MTAPTDPPSTAPSAALTLTESDLAAHAGEQIFGVSRYSDDDPDRSRNDLGSMHTFPAAHPNRKSIHPGWVGKLTVPVGAKYLGGLVGDETSALCPPLTQAFLNHMAIVVQNATGSCKPYHIAGFPIDDGRFAAWTAMVQSGLVDIAFLVDAHCGPVNIQGCQAYTRSMGNVATRGAPTTAQTWKRLTDPAEGLPTTRGIQPGGILMLISPALQSKAAHTTHRCSGRLFRVHLRHGEDELVIVALYGVSAPQTDDKKSMRAQLAAAMAQIAHEYAGVPMLVVGGHLHGILMLATGPRGRAPGRQSGSSLRDPRLEEHETCAWAETCSGYPECMSRKW